MFLSWAEHYSVARCEGDGRVVHRIDTAVMFFLSLADLCGVSVQHDDQLHAGGAHLRAADGRGVRALRRVRLLVDACGRLARADVHDRLDRLDRIVG